MPAHRPWTITAAIAVAVLGSIASYFELELRTGDGSTFTLGGPAFLGAVAVGLHRRWRSGWWIGVLASVLGMLVTLFVVKLAGATYAVVNAAGCAVLLGLLLARGSKDWMLGVDAERGLGALVLTIGALSIAVSLLVSAT